MREAFGIIKKDFYKLIINIIIKKKQMTIEIVMTRTLDTLMTKKEEKEIRYVYILICDNVGNNNQSKKIYLFFIRLKIYKLKLSKKFCMMRYKIRYCKCFYMIE